MPLWVADMEFATPKAVTDALTKRIAHGIFGYSGVDKEYFNTYLGWQARHENTPFKEEWLQFSTGVVQAIYDLVDFLPKKEKL
ncbi:pyridoxal phosphate-dependent transferase [Enterococcus cecorum]|nr:pyridoxal phosphate-dependent transferase [Enterococcus cecorum]